MGYAYNELIPPAILLDNPGMTANEFNSKISDDNISRKILLMEPPIYTLPRLLNLPSTQSFIEFDQLEKDSYDLPLSAPRADLFKSPYSVELHIRNELSSPKKYKNIEWKKINDKQLTYLHGPDYWPSELKCLVNHVLSTKKVKLSPDDIDYCDGVEENNNVFECEFLGQEIKEITETQAFESIEELFKEWPQFKPENKFDFSISNGVFYAQHILMENFRWKQINGRYYFDERSFDLMPAGSRHIRRHGAGYTDLIITAEAIKNKGMHLLNYRARDDEGEEDLQLFIENLPEISRRRIETAIWDSHTSIFTKGKEMTYFELIRFRLPPHEIHEDNYDSLV